MHMEMGTDSPTDPADPDPIEPEAEALPETLPDPKPDEMNEYDSVSAEDWLEEKIPVSPGGTLYIDLDRGSVEVTSHDKDEVWLEGESRGWGAGMVLFTAEKEGNAVYFDASIDGWMPFVLGGPKVRVRATVPRNFSVEIETRGGKVRAEHIGGRLGCETRGGHVEVQEIDGPVLIRTSGGHVKARHVSGDLRAKTSGGDIRIEDIGGDVETRTSGGHIEVEDAFGEVDAKTSGGHVTVSFREEPWGRLETSGGHISIEVPSDVGFDLDARTSGGHIRADHPDFDPRDRRRSKLKRSVNGGGPPLKLRSSGGGVKLRGV
jgi:hypothetical protein